MCNPDGCNCNRLGRPLRLVHREPRLPSTTATNIIGNQKGEFSYFTKKRKKQHGRDTGEIWIAELKNVPLLRTHSTFITSLNSKRGSIVNEERNA